VQNSRIWRDSGALVAHLERLREQGRRIVTTNGCFELLHVGHVSYLEAARGEGDVLVVLVNSDASMRRIKPEREIVVPEEERMAMLAALRCVDFVLPFDEDTPQELLARIRPDVHAKGTDYRADELPEREVVESHGGRIAILGDPKTRSATELRKRLSGDA